MVNPDKWFLVAKESTHQRRGLTADTIVKLVENFILNNAPVPVTYDFYPWSPIFCHVKEVKVETIDDLVCLFALIPSVPELRGFSENGRVPHYLTIGYAPQSHGPYKYAPALAEISATQNPTIAGLDLLTFSVQPVKI